MKNKKTIIIFAILVTVLLIGTTTGIAMALDQQTEKEKPSKIFFERVGEILGISGEKVEAAFKQAAKELREQKFEAYLKGLVEKGKITQEQAEQYKKWLKSKPDFELPWPNKMPGLMPKIRPFK